MNANVTGGAAVNPQWLAAYDSTSASALGTNQGLVTERDVYYGLPTINNSHGYTSSTTIYAPTAGGTADYYLKANGATSTPTWEAKGSVASSNTKLVDGGTVYTYIKNLFAIKKPTMTLTGASPFSLSWNGTPTVLKSGPVVNVRGVINVSVTTALTAGTYSAGGTYSFSDGSTAAGEQGYFVTLLDPGNNVRTTIAVMFGGGKIGFGVTGGANLTVGTRYTLWLNWTFVDSSWNPF